MRRALQYFLFIVFLLSVSAADAHAFSARHDFSTLDAFIQAQRAKHGLPGVAVAVIDDGQVVYLKGYGVDGDGNPLSPQTRMLIGSQSKSFTALAVAQLAEQGKLDLNAPVQTYIPWFRVADEEASSRITINHLLHHTSGLSDAGFAVIVPDQSTPEQAVRSLAAAKLTAPIGTRHQYFNMGYSVLAYLIEISSGQTYAEYIQEHIFTPLGMRSSTADVSAAHNIPSGYTRLFGFPVPMSEKVPAYGAGEGFIISTAEDMARYAIAVQDGGAGLISPEMMKQIMTPGIGAYGMGWYIVDYGSKIFHGGANQTFRTEFNIYPSRGRSFVLLTNLGYQVDHFISAGQLTAGVEAIVLGNTPAVVTQGWSVRWIGWALGILVLSLTVLHTRNFLRLRNWRERTRNFSTTKRLWDVIISFLIPTLILIVVFWQVKGFYGNRFNLLTNLAYMRFGLPDVFILMLVGTLPDFLQGLIKLALWPRKALRQNPARAQTFPESSE